VGYPARCRVPTDANNNNNNNNTNTNTMKNQIEALAIVNGVNAPFVAKCVEFATLSQSRETLAASLKTEFAAILAATGTKEAVAAKQLSASLKVALEGVVSHPDKRASEILVAVGIRQRAEKATSKSKQEKDAALAPVIEALVALAQEKAGEDAVSALRRAYLTLQAKNNA
jgi:hypothetical protein